MDESTKPNMIFWIVAIVSLVWNGMGAMNFFVQMQGSAQLPENYQMVVDHRPTWATAGFGIGMATSVLGSIALLLRRAWAYPMFVVAFLGTLVTLLHAAPVQFGSGKFGTGELILTVVLPILISIFLVWFSSRSKEKGWLT